MTEPHHDDELTRRYREASAQDTRRPGEQVRQAVRAHAEMVIASGSQTAAKPEAPQAAAANRSRWKISVLAGVALAGLTGLLVLQFDRGTPQEQELAFGRPSASTSPTPSASPSSPSSPPYPAPRETAANASLPAAAPLVTAKPARPTADSNATPAGQSLRKAAPRPHAEPSPALEARPAAPSARLADAAAPSEAPGVQSSSAGGPAPAPLMRAAPAARAPAPEQKQDSLALQAPRLRAEVGSAQDLTAALHEAARTGSVSQAERLLQQGASLNAPDEAGRTPLILAVIHGHAAMVQRLMALGANPALVDQGGLTALQYARRLGLDRIASLIEAGSR